MIFPAILLFFVLLFFGLWVWHHLRKRAILIKQRVSTKATRQKDKRNHEAKEQR